MKRILRILCAVVALMFIFCVYASAEPVDLYDLANRLCQIDVEYHESSARYYENERLFTYSMQNTATMPIVWESLDDATIQEHYMAYVRMTMQLEDMIWGNGYNDVTVVTTFQLADGTAVYLTVNGLDCSRMVYQ